jgi:uncharacterized protein YndB with AHSA1/START domain
MEPYNWSQFTKRIALHAPMDTIYKCWATQAGLESWFLRMAEFRKPDGSTRPPDGFIQAGDNYSWMWHGWPDTVNEKNKVLEANGIDLFQFGFAEVCVVTIKISVIQNMHMVELTQSEIPTDDEHKAKWHLGCLEGWTFYLANLKSILEGGLDLRNKSLDIGIVINS